MRDGRRRRLWPALFTVGLFSLAAIGAVIAVALASPGPAQLTLRMRPVPPLTIAACIGELTPYGFSPGGASQLCSFGAGRSWYRAVLTNHGGGAYPLCHARALDSAGVTVFSGPVFFAFGGGIAGLYARSHHSVTFSWYLPDVSRPIARYVAACSVNDNPPV